MNITYEFSSQTQISLCLSYESSFFHPLRPPPFAYAVFLFPRCLVPYIISASFAPPIIIAGYHQPSEVTGTIFMHLNIHSLSTCLTSRTSLSTTQSEGVVPFIQSACINMTVIVLLTTISSLPLF